MSAGRWLVKTEPHVYSIDDLAADRRTRWDGVRNHAAKGHLAAMRKGDRVLVYHSNADPSAVVGEARVAREAYPDPTVDDPRHPMFDPKRVGQAWVAVDLAFVRRWKRPVPLADVKANRRLARMALLRLPRLSVQPVLAAQWREVAAMAGERP